jgi:energy-coupling factor transporter ATP-binding protein EcfA2
MLESITLKFTENNDLTLPASGITVFVGPNNSGKSLLLRELELALSSNPLPTGLKLLRDYQVTWPSIEEVKTSIAKMSALKVANQQPSLPAGHVIVCRINPNGGLETTTLDEASLLSYLTSKHNKAWLASQYLRWGLVRLDGRSRFNLTNDQAAGDLLGLPNNTLAHLF